MRRFVFWTGIYNIAMGIILSCPWVVDSLGVKVPPSNLWLWLPAILVIYIGVLLIFCSKDLAARGSLVYWEGILRLGGFFVLGGFGFLSDIGIIVGVIGVIDLVIGLVYLIGLPMALNKKGSSLLLDRL
ncbi:MAG: hypothetical protein QUS33_06425 [Dehalococcoidia bacterium]|nr:hypothetical protein [Dehalococcoidia bacterium]